LKGRISERFQLTSHKTTIRQELTAGTVSFFTIVYIIAVNAAILSDAGIPLEAAIFATVLTSVTGCFIVGFWSNAPITLVPGMGVNALFAYTFVQSMGLTWQEALAAVFVSGILFTVISFTNLSNIISKAIPSSLKEAITVGIGLFLTFIGLQKGGLIQPSDSTYITIGDLSSPLAIATLITLFITLILFIRNVKGHFLISMVSGTVIAFGLGMVKTDQLNGMNISFSAYNSVIGSMSFEKIMSLPFWMAVFSLTMVLVFENIGLIHGHLHMSGHPEKFQRALQANALSAITSGFFGSSPTVSTVESAAGIAAGGRTGLSAITTGILFGLSILFVPFLKIIPDSAIAPILIVVGGLMIQNIKSINLQDFSEGFPAFLVIALIPLTYSIAEGIAFGFIAYPILKIAIGKAKEVPLPLYFIASLFFINFILHFAH
jgi:adenine/guanine/hypoxanthine permease